MNIKIIAGAWAKKYNIYNVNREELSVEVEVDCEYGANIADVLAELSLPANEVGITSLNGKAAPRGATLRDGDKLEIFPVIIDGYDNDHVGDAACHAKRMSKYSRNKQK